MEIALLSEELFIENSPIKEDTVISKFVPYIIIAQKMHIRDILGLPLYTQLQQQIAQTDETGTNHITPENKALLQAIAPALSFWAVYQGLPFHWAAIVNKGFTTRESENSGAVSGDTLGQQRRYLRDDAAFLTKDLVNYLCRCKGRYPLWIPGTYCGGGCGGDKKTNTDTGFFIPFD